MEPHGHYMDFSFPPEEGGKTLEDFEKRSNRT